jgi:hypothetical protein
MHRDDDLTFAPLFMLVSVKAAALFGQPFPKCGAFHCFAPLYPYAMFYTQNRIAPLRLSLTRNLSIMRKFSDASVDLRQTPKRPLMAHFDHSLRRRAMSSIGHGSPT